jgi:hypothetical protein
MSRLFMSVLALFIAAPAMTNAAPHTPYDRAMRPFIAELDRQCPGRRLQDLSAGDLELVMEGFEERLAPAQRRQVQDAVGYRCARIEAGLTCGNVASLDVFRRIGVLPRFVHEVCATTWTCRGFADCAQAKP